MSPSGTFATLEMLNSGPTKVSNEVKADYF
jgi:hypothetical protein